VKIKDLGESKIIEKIWEFLGRENENEDVHFFLQGNKYLLVAMDTLNENIHFRRDWDPFKIGKFLVDINMSDIISKNGLGLQMMASFTFPRDLDYDWVERLTEGIFKELEKFKVTYEGGDMKEGEKISLTGLIIGEVEKGREIRRKGVEPGDYIYITNKIGKQYLEYLKYLNGSSNGEGIIDVDVSYDKLKNIMKYSPKAAMDDSDGPFKSLAILSNLNKVKIKLENNVCIVDDYKNCYSFGGDYELIFSSSIFTKDLPLLARAYEGSGLYDFNNEPIEFPGYEHYAFKKLK
jgi:thiamine-monophosphate kinase